MLKEMLAAQAAEGRHAVSVEVPDGYLLTRTGGFPGGVFLAINGYRLIADQVDAIRTMLALAAGKLDEPGLAAWIESNCERL